MNDEDVVLDKQPRRALPRINVSAVLQAVANIALVVIAALALKVQTDSAGVEGFFRSEIVTRNEQISDLRRETSEATHNLDEIRRQVSEAQAERTALAATIDQWEQGAAQQRFVGLLTVSGRYSNVSDHQEYRTAIEALRGSDEHIRVPFSDPIPLGESLLDQLRSAELSTVTSIDRRVATLRSEFLRDCSTAIRALSYEPPPLEEPITISNRVVVFGIRSRAFSESWQRVETEARNCAESLPSYRRDTL